MPIIECRTRIYEETGIAYSEEWSRREEGSDHGCLHRTDGPASIERDPQTGVATTEYWYDHGALHRPNGPAVIYRTAEGLVHNEEWYRHGKLHRDDGPAVVVHDRQTGAVTRQQWWSDGSMTRDAPGNCAPPLSPRSSPLDHSLDDRGSGTLGRYRIA